MNYRLVLAQLGLLASLLSGIMLAMAGLQISAELGAGHTLDKPAMWALLISGAAGLLIGASAWLFNRRGSKYLGRKEALLLVATSWIAGAVLAAAPYRIWAALRFDPGEEHPFQSFVSCYFEAMSGLTTTGASVLSDIEAIPRSLLLWRALTQWLGGVGIVVLFVAVLPGLGVGGKRLYQFEASGPAKTGLRPHIRDTARWLWFFYLGLSGAEILALWGCTSMPLFDAICHTFATVATGGFSTRNASVGAWQDDPAVGWIVVVFMIVSGVNFGLFYQMRKGGVLSVLRDTEFRFYLVLLLCGSAAAAWALALSGQDVALTSGATVENTPGEATRHAVFTIVSIQTTTGFCTADYNHWPFLAQGMIVLLMFVGGCAGSTSGGIKVIRVWVALTVLFSEVERVFRPGVVRPVRLGDATLDADLKLATVSYALGIVLIFVLGAGGLMLLEALNPGSDCRFTSAATAVSACLFTTGPGLAQVGAVENYGWFSSVSKLVLCLVMVVGRLEVFAIAVLFSPSFWRRD